jgi:ribose/xylose/arabinose/galactoside ABC-type transport system permease subunit
MWTYFNIFKNGKIFRAVGENNNSATLQGININRVKMEAFLIAGIIYGIGTILFICSFKLSRPSEFQKDMLIPILCCILSGSSIYGGKLPVFSIFLGASSYLIIDSAVQGIMAPEAYQLFFGIALLFYIWLRAKSFKTR